MAPVPRPFHLSGPPFPGHSTSVAPHSQAIPPQWLLIPNSIELSLCMKQASHTLVWYPDFLSQIFSCSFEQAQDDFMRQYHCDVTSLRIKGNGTMERLLFSHYCQRVSLGTRKMQDRDNIPSKASSDITVAPTHMQNHPRFSFKIFPKAVRKRHAHELTPFPPKLTCNLFSFPDVACLQ